MRQNADKEQQGLPPPPDRSGAAPKTDGTQKGEMLGVRSVLTLNSFVRHFARSPN